MSTSIEKKKKLLIFFYIFFSLTFKKINTTFLAFNVFFFFKLKCFFKINKYYNFLSNNAFKLILKTKNTFTDSFQSFSSIIEQNLIKKSSYSIKNTKFNFNNNPLSSLFNKNFYYKLLNFFFLNSFLPNNSFFPRTSFFRFFFFKNSKGSSYVINLNKILNR